MEFVKIVLLLGAALFAGFGILLLIAPGKMAAVDLAPTSGNGRAEVRAMYGGLEIALAVFLFLCFQFSEFLNTGLTLQAFALAGIAGGRIVGILLERGRVSRLIYVFAALESAAAIITYIAVNHPR